VAELGRGWLHYHRQHVAFVMASKSGLRAGAAFTLPEQIGNWKRLDAAVPNQKEKADHKAYVSGMAGVYADWAAQVAKTDPHNLALRLVRELGPDVVVLDLNLSDGNGTSLLEQLRSLGAVPPCS
jgi:CheY-like chemotaxis protein